MHKLKLYQLDLTGGQIQSSKFAISRKGTVKGMDLSTIGYYSHNAQVVAERYEAIVSALSSHFSDAFHRNSRILDIGCGSGRDLAQLAGLGHQVYGVDPVDEFVNLSQAIHPELEGRITKAALPDLGTPYGGEFDGVLCSAVLMHLPEPTLSHSVRAIRGCLTSKGRVLLSIPSERSDLESEDRDQNGRLFRSCTPTALDALFSAEGFHRIACWSDSDSLGRDGVKWVSLLYEVK